MDEYISREAFKARIREQQKKCASPDEIAAFTVFSFLLQAVDEEPAADVQPVKHGQWIDHEKFERKNSNVCIECSVCNTWFGHDCIPKTKFCPNCGARMDSDTNG